MPWGLTTQKIWFTEVRLRALHAIVTMTIITWIIKLTCFTQELWTNSKAESVFSLVLNKNVFNHFIWCFSVLRPASKTLDFLLYFVMMVKWICAVLLTCQITWHYNMIYYNHLLLSTSSYESTHQGSARLLESSV